jgi:outer membrane immunogenic protein
MKTKKIFYTVCTTTLAIILTGLTQAHAGTAPEAVQPQGSEFSGGYVGFKLGENRSNASGVAPRARHDTTFPGLVAGYAFDAGPLVLGAEAFTDFHHGSATGKDGGLDAKVGVPVGKLMPYARLGFTGSWPDTRLHGGLGVEYKLSSQFGLAGEWTADTSRSSGTKRRNDSFSVVLNYHFQ